MIKNSHFNLKMNQSRIKHLIDISQMVIHGEITYKLNHIATIFVNGRNYFNIFRRYNSPYNIIIEDYNEDIYLRENNSIRTLLQSVMCLSDHDTNEMYTINAFSYHNNGPIPSIFPDILDSDCIDIHTRYQTISLSLNL